MRVLLVLKAQTSFHTLPMFWTPYSSDLLPLSSEACEQPCLSPSNQWVMLAHSDAGLGMWTMVTAVLSVNEWSIDVCIFSIEEPAERPLS